MTDEINNWVAQETRNKIQNIVPRDAINASIRLVLANAMYFFGAWTTAFAEANTSTQPFYLSSTTLVEAPLMHQPLLKGVAPNGNPVNVTFNYMQCCPMWSAPGSSNDFQAIELPYGSNQLSMLILLPSQIDGLGRLEQQLSPAFLSAPAGNGQAGGWNQNCARREGPGEKQKLEGQTLKCWSAGRRRAQARVKAPHRPPSGYLVANR